MAPDPRLSGDDLLLDQALRLYAEACCKSHALFGAQERHEQLLMTG